MTVAYDEVRAEAVFGKFWEGMAKSRRAPKPFSGASCQVPTKRDAYVANLRKLEAIWNHYEKKGVTLE